MFEEDWPDLVDPHLPGAVLNAFVGEVDDQGRLRPGQGAPIGGSGEFAEGERAEFGQ